MKEKTQDGITLVALVVTIIILLILAGVTIATLAGKNGILTKAEKAKDETVSAQYKENLELEQASLNADKIINDWTSKEYMDQYYENLVKNPEFEGATIVRKDDETIQVTTKDGEVFEITEDKVEHLGTQGEDVPPDLQEQDIDFEVSPSGWTNTDVTVQIKSKIEGYTLQYSLDGTTWDNYTEGINITENKAIYARLINKLGETGKYATGNIKNIDKEKPTVEIEAEPGNYTILAGETTASTTTTITANDTGGSKLKTLQYQFTTQETTPDDDDRNWKTFNNGETITEGLSGGNMYLYTKITDNAGNKATDGQKIGPFVVNYQIKYDANGGTGGPTETTKTHGETLTISETQPTRENYVFAGWATTNTATTGTYQAGGQYNENAAVTLYAIWTANQYTINLNNQNASTAGTTSIYERYGAGIYLDKEQTKQMTTSSNGITIPAKTYVVTYNYNGNGQANSSNTGTYTFGGYYTEQNGGGKEMIGNTGKITSNFTNTSYTANGTLYAKWTGGTVTLPTPTRTNYTFSGWYTAASGGTKVGDAGATYSPTSAITLYARWTPAPKVSITANPSAATVVAGNRVTFSMGATGSGTISYQWYYNTQNSTSGGTAITGATGSSCTFTTSTGWNGRYLYCIATSTVESSKATATTTTALLTVQAANYSITNSGTTTYYNTLATAHAGAASGNTITVLQNVSDSSAVTISKHIVLNTNAKTITRTAAIYTSGSANLTITGSGTITSSVRVLEHHGTGTVTLNGPTLTATTYACIDIYNGGGKFVLTSGTVNAGTNGILNYSGGTTTINGGKVNAATTGGTSASVYVDGGSCSVTGGLIYGNGISVSGENGNVNVSGGQMQSMQQYAIYMSNTSNLTITGTSIGRFDGEASLYSYASNMPVVGNEGTGTLYIYHGYMRAKASVAIYNFGGGTLLLGNANTTLNDDRPWARGETYGVNNKNGKFYFYNGFISGKTGRYTGTLTGCRSGTTIQNNTVTSGDGESLLGAYLK